MKSIEKRLKALEAKNNPVSIFGDWCLARNPEWSGSDQDAFSEWLEFQETASETEYQDENLNPDVGFHDSLHSHRV